MTNTQTNVQAISTVIPSKATSQPRGLYLLFFTEMWERFGFYTLQTIIILYMTKALVMSDQEANLTYAAFSALLYLTPTIGGYLADKYLGFQLAILVGGALFIIGYLLCASPFTWAFFLGLSVIICANGFFKPNVSSIVGELYKENDPRRDGGFTLFYMGINLGALTPPLIAGALVTHYGWRTGFLMAAIGMTIGQIIFYLGRKQLGNAGLRPRENYNFNFKFNFLFALGVLSCITLSYLAFLRPQITNALVAVATVAVLGIVLLYLSKEPVAQRKKMFAALLLIAISVAFWSLYNQAFTSITLFADHNMEKSFLGFAFDAEASQFFNPFFIIVLSPVLSQLWLRMDRFGLNPSTQIKFFLGIFFISGGFLVLAFASRYLSENGLISPNVLCVSYCFQTIGELLISPIGLAMITVLSPKHLVGMMMGVWFFAQAASFAIAGCLANLAAIPHQMSAEASLPIYSHAFLIYGFVALSMAVVSFACIPLLNWLVKE